jgi:GT2 family glycosyltransferase
MTAGSPTITAVVATRDRGDSAVMTVESLLASDLDDFAVVVVDQSDADTTERALARFGDDPRFRYIRTDTVGVGRAQNLAVATIGSPYVAFTDDDCEVEPNWLSHIATIFDRHPEVAVLYTNVVPGPHDEEAGFVPAYIRHDDKHVGSILAKTTARGIGAGMAARREPFVAMGGFDENMGPGAVIPSAADRDLAIRAVIAGWCVYETCGTKVVHHGFRTWEQGKGLTERNWFGLGAMCAKPVRAGHPTTIVYSLYELGWNAFLQPMARLRTGKRPQGFKRIVHFARGFREGWRTPIDPDRLVFLVDADGG